MNEDELQSILNYLLTMHEVKLINKRSKGLVVSFSLAFIKQTLFHVIKNKQLKSVWKAEIFTSGVRSAEVFESIRKALVLS